ncbi:uncharacterized protein LOC126610850 isoform X1 [Malus sylvestris]|uniref:uncharacterized protein LOC126610850 isoform X1 n=1 Tax=Malus sylvestris TaxID=3752 RepID=UPI0021AD049F|nr:uncharacterized protein LOC126610850 isoform X1 [Malus sylvestris]XP_050134953.1 uncharacterized protein LOC126610850 isoform X1 [Malus sylvestris]
MKLQIRDKQHEKNTLSRQLFSTKPCVSQASTHHGFKFHSCRSKPFTHATVPEMHKETEKTDSNSPQTHGSAKLECRTERKHPLSCRSSGPRRLNKRQMPRPLQIRKELQFGPCTEVEDMISSDISGPMSI